MRLVTVAIYPVRLLLFHYETKLNRVGFILNRMSFSEKLFFIIFQGCFTVQLSRFLLNLFDSVCYALPRQRVLSYQRYILLSTLFCNFFQKNTNYIFSTISWCFVSGRPQEIFCILSSDTKTTLWRTGLSLTEKEGFEPSRRANDLYP